MVNIMRWACVGMHCSYYCINNELEYLYCMLVSSNSEHVEALTEIPHLAFQS